MCLTDPKILPFKTRLFNKFIPQIGYKAIFILDNNIAVTPLQTQQYSFNHYHQADPYKSIPAFIYNKEQRQQGVLEEYPAGFHIFPYRQDALKWARIHLRLEKNVHIIKVKYKGIQIQGYEQPNLTCVVAKYIKFLKHTAVSI